MSIYELMKKDWKTYCLMSSIIYIEEVKKPTEHPQIKEGRKYVCYHTTRLKMKDEEVVRKIFDITKKWETTKRIRLIGKKFITPIKENNSNQDKFIFSPNWLNLIISECGKIPNKYSFETAIERINHLKQYKKIPISKNKNLFNLLLKDKRLAAGAFIVSMDLEFRGIQSGNPSLCMSERYKDFLEFMLKLAQKWNWTKNKELSKVSVDYSIKLGINASPQYEFRINIKGLQEIYKLAGPLANSHKNKCIEFHVHRSKKYINLGGGLRKNMTKEKIINELKKNKNLTTTEMQFIAGVRIDVILDHLHKLEKEGKVNKERRGKRYVWNLK